MNCCNPSHYSAPLHIVFVFRCVVNNTLWQKSPQIIIRVWGFFFHSECPRKTILTLLFSPELKCVFFITSRASAVKLFALKFIYGPSFVYQKQNCLITFFFQEELSIMKHDWYFLIHCHIWYTDSFSTWTQCLGVCIAMHSYHGEIPQVHKQELELAARGETPWSGKMQVQSCRARCTSSERHTMAPTHLHHAPGVGSPVEYTCRGKTQTKKTRKSCTRLISPGQSHGWGGCGMEKCPTLPASAAGWSVLREPWMNSVRVRYQPEASGKWTELKE